jgi:hypothetical protein
LVSSPQRAGVFATITFIILIILAVLTATVTTAMPPQPGASGIDGSCRSCHTPNDDYNGVSVGASITIEGIPGTFVHGHEYTITVVIERGLGPQPSYDILHAFQLGVTNGTLGIANATCIQIGEREVGSQGASEVDRWSVKWTAPFSYENVAFMAEGVVGNGDGTEAGDVRLSTTITSFAPLNVPPDESLDPWPYWWAAILTVVAVTGIAGYVIVVTHRPPPLGPED